MPQVFKALASITVWILFLGGCVLGIMGTLGYFIHVGFGSPPEPSNFMAWGIAAADLFLSAVAAKFRQMME